MEDIPGRAARGYTKYRQVYPLPEDIHGVIKKYYPCISSLPHQIRGIPLSEACILNPLHIFIYE